MTSIPETFFKHFSEKYPKALHYANDCRNQKGRGLINFPDYIYLPLTFWQSIVQAHTGEFAKTHAIVREAKILAATLTWNFDQYIHKTDAQTLEAILAEQDTAKLSVSLLKNLPAWSIYVDCQNHPIGNTILNGFYAFIEWNTQDSEIQLELLRIQNDNQIVPLTPIVLGQIERIQEWALQLKKRANPSPPVLGNWEEPEEIKPNHPILTIVSRLCSTPIKGTDHETAYSPPHQRPRESNNDANSITVNILPEAD